ncbi:MAG: hypothetical protein WCP85_00160 [Mariniphaga sp.]
MENETPKAIWQKPEIIDLDIKMTSKGYSEFVETKDSGPAGS